MSFVGVSVGMPFFWAGVFSFFDRLLLKEYNGGAATAVLCIVWGAAVFGIVYQYTFHER